MSAVKPTSLAQGLTLAETAGMSSLQEAFMKTGSLMFLKTMTWKI